MLIMVAVVGLLEWFAPLGPFQPHHPLLTIGRLIVFLFVGRVVADAVAPYLQLLLWQVAATDEAVETITLLPVWGQHGLILREDETGEITYRSPVDGLTENVQSDATTTLRIIGSEEGVLRRRTRRLVGMGRWIDALIRPNRRRVDRVILEFHVPATSVFDYFEQTGIIVGDAMMPKQTFLDRIRRAGAPQISAGD